MNSASFVHPANFSELLFHNIDPNSDNRTFDAQYLANINAIGPGLPADVNIIFDAEPTVLPGQSTRYTQNTPLNLLDASIPKFTPKQIPAQTAIERVSTQSIKEYAPTQTSFVFTRTGYGVDPDRPDYVPFFSIPSSFASTHDDAANLTLRAKVLGNYTRARTRPAPTSYVEHMTTRSDPAAQRIQDFDANMVHEILPTLLMKYKSNKLQAEISQLEAALRSKSIQQSKQKPKKKTEKPSGQRSSQAGLDDPTSSDYHLDRDGNKTFKPSQLTNPMDYIDYYDEEEFSFSSLTHLVTGRRKETPMNAGTSEAGGIDAVAVDTNQAEGSNDAMHADAQLSEEYLNRKDLDSDDDDDDIDALVNSFALTSDTDFIPPRNVSDSQEMAPVPTQSTMQTLRSKYDQLTRSRQSKDTQQITVEPIEDVQLLARHHTTLDGDEDDTPPMLFGDTDEEILQSLLVSGYIDRLPGAMKWVSDTLDQHSALRPVLLHRLESSLPYDNDNDDADADSNAQRSPGEPLGQHTHPMTQTQPQPTPSSSKQEEYIDLLLNRSQEISLQQLREIYLRQKQTVHQHYTQVLPHLQEQQRNKGSAPGTVWDYPHDGAPPLLPPEDVPLLYQTQGSFLPLQFRWGHHPFHDQDHIRSFHLAMVLNNLTPIGFNELPVLVRDAQVFFLSTYKTGLWTPYDQSPMPTGFHHAAVTFPSPLRHVATALYQRRQGLDTELSAMDLQHADICVVLHSHFCPRYYAMVTPLEWIPIDPLIHPATHDIAPILDALYNSIGKVIQKDIIASLLRKGAIGASANGSAGTIPDEASLAEQTLAVESMVDAAHATAAAQDPLVPQPKPLPALTLDALFSDPDTIKSKRLRTHLNRLRSEKSDIVALEHLSQTASFTIIMLFRYMVQLANEHASASSLYNRARSANTAFPSMPESDPYSIPVSPRIHPLVMEQTHIHQNSLFYNYIHPFYPLSKAGIEIFNHLNYIKPVNALRSYPEIDVEMSSRCNPPPKWRQSAVRQVKRKSAHQAVAQVLADTAAQPLTSVVQQDTAEALSKTSTDMPSQPSRLIFTTSTLAPSPPITSESAGQTLDGQEAGTPNTKKKPVKRTRLELDPVTEMDINHYNSLPTLQLLAKIPFSQQRFDTSRHLAYATAYFKTLTKFLAPHHTISQSSMENIYFRNTLRTMAIPYDLLTAIIKAESRLFHATRELNADYHQDVGVIHPLSDSIQLRYLQSKLLVSIIRPAVKNHRTDALSRQVLSTATAPTTDDQKELVVSTATALAMGTLPDTIQSNAVLMTSYLKTASKNRYFALIRTASTLTYANYISSTMRHAQHALTGLLTKPSSTNGTSTSTGPAPRPEAIPTSLEEMLDSFDGFRQDKGDSDSEDFLDRFRTHTGTRPTPDRSVEHNTPANSFLEALGQRHSTSLHHDSIVYSSTGGITSSCYGFIHTHGPSRRHLAYSVMTTPDVNAGATPLSMETNPCETIGYSPPFVHGISQIAKLPYDIGTQYQAICRDPTGAIRSVDVATLDDMITTRVVARSTRETIVFDVGLTNSSFTSTSDDQDDTLNSDDTTDDTADTHYSSQFVEHQISPSPVDIASRNALEYLEQVRQHYQHWAGTMASDSGLNAPEALSDDLASTFYIDAYRPRATFNPRARLVFPIPILHTATHPLVADQASYLTVDGRIFVWDMARDMTYFPSDAGPDMSSNMASAIRDTVYIDDRFNLQQYSLYHNQQHGYDWTYREAVLRQALPDNTYALAYCNTASWRRCQLVDNWWIGTADRQRDAIRELNTASELHTLAPSDVHLQPHRDSYRFQNPHFHYPLAGLARLPFPAWGKIEYSHHPSQLYGALPHSMWSIDLRAPAVRPMSDKTIQSSHHTQDGPNTDPNLGMQNGVRVPIQLEPEDKRIYDMAVDHHNNPYHVAISTAVSLCLFDMRYPHAPALRWKLPSVPIARPSTQPKSFSWRNQDDYTAPAVRKIEFRHVDHSLPSSLTTGHVSESRPAMVQQGPGNDIIPIPIIAEVSVGYDDTVFIHGYRAHMPPDYISSFISLSAAKQFVASAMGMSSLLHSYRTTMYLRRLLSLTSSSHSTAISPHPQQDSQPNTTYHIVPSPAGHNMMGTPFPSKSFLYGASHQAKRHWLFEYVALPSSPCGGPLLAACGLPIPLHRTRHVPSHKFLMIRRERLLPGQARRKPNRGIILLKKFRRNLNKLQANLVAYSIHSGLSWSEQLVGEQYSASSSEKPLHLKGYGYLNRLAVHLQEEKKNLFRGLSKRPSSKAKKGPVSSAIRIHDFYLPPKALQKRIAMKAKWRRERYQSFNRRKRLRKGNLKRLAKLIKDIRKKRASEKAREPNQKPASQTTTTVNSSRPQPTTAKSSQHTSSYFRHRRINSFAFGKSADVVFRNSIRRRQQQEQRFQHTAQPRRSVRSVFHPTVHSVRPQRHRRRYKPSHRRQLKWVLDALQKPVTRIALEGRWATRFKFITQAYRARAVDIAKSRVPASSLNTVIESRRKRGRRPWLRAFKRVIASKDAYKQWTMTPRQRIKVAMRLRAFIRSQKSKDARRRSLSASLDQQIENAMQDTNDKDLSILIPLPAIPTPSKHSTNQQQNDVGPDPGRSDASVSAMADLPPQIPLTEDAAASGGMESDPVEDLPLGMTDTFDLSTPMASFALTSSPLLLPPRTSGSFQPTEMGSFMLDSTHEPLQTAEMNRTPQQTSQPTSADKTASLRPTIRLLPSHRLILQQNDALFSSMVDATLQLAPWAYSTNAISRVSRRWRVLSNSIQNTEVLQNTILQLSSMDRPSGAYRASSTVRSITSTTTTNTSTPQLPDELEAQPQSVKDFFATAASQTQSRTRSLHRTVTFEDQPMVKTFNSNDIISLTLDGSQNSNSAGHQPTILRGPSSPSTSGIRATGSGFDAAHSANLLDDSDFLQTVELDSGVGGTSHASDQDDDSRHPSGYHGLTEDSGLDADEHSEMYNDLLHIGVGEDDIPQYRFHPVQKHISHDLSKHRSPYHYYSKLEKLNKNTILGNPNELYTAVGDDVFTRILKKIHKSVATLYQQRLQGLNFWIKYRPKSVRTPGLMVTPAGHIPSTSVPKFHVFREKRRRDLLRVPLRTISSHIYLLPPRVPMTYLLSQYDVMESTPPTDSCGNPAGSSALTPINVSITPILTAVVRTHIQSQTQLTASQEGSLYPVPRGLLLGSDKLQTSLPYTLSVLQIKFNSAMTSSLYRLDATSSTSMPSSMILDTLSQSAPNDASQPVEQSNNSPSWQELLSNLINTSTACLPQTGNNTLSHAASSAIRSPLATIIPIAFDIESGKPLPNALTTIRRAMYRSLLQSMSKRKPFHHTTPFMDLTPLGENLLAVLKTFYQQRAPVLAMPPHCKARIDVPITDAVVNRSTQSAFERFPIPVSAPLYLWPILTRELLFVYTTHMDSPNSVIRDAALSQYCERRITVFDVLAKLNDISADIVQFLAFSRTTEELLRFVCDQLKDTFHIIPPSAIRIDHHSQISRFIEVCQPQVSAQHGHDQSQPPSILDWIDRYRLYWLCPAQLILEALCLVIRVTAELHRSPPPVVIPAVASSDSGCDPINHDVYIFDTSAMSVGQETALTSMVTRNTFNSTPTIEFVELQKQARYRHVLTILQSLLEQPPLLITSFTNTPLDVSPACHVPLFDLYFHMISLPPNTYVYMNRNLDDAVTEPLDDPDRRPNPVCYCSLTNFPRALSPREGRFHQSYNVSHSTYLPVPCSSPYCMVYTYGFFSSHLPTQTYPLPPPVPYAPGTNIQATLITLGATIDGTDHRQEPSSMNTAPAATSSLYTASQPFSQTQTQASREELSKKLSQNIAKKNEQFMMDVLFRDDDDDDDDDDDNENDNNNNNNNNNDNTDNNDRDGIHDEDNNINLPGDSHHQLTNTTNGIRTVSTTPATSSSPFLDSESGLVTNHSEDNSQQDDGIAPTQGRHQHEARPAEDGSYSSYVKEQLGGCQDNDNYPLQHIPNPYRYDSELCVTPHIVDYCHQTTKSSMQEDQDEHHSCLAPGNLSSEAPQYTADIMLFAMGLHVMATEGLAYSLLDQMPSEDCGE